MPRRRAGTAAAGRCSAAARRAAIADAGRRAWRVARGRTATPLRPTATRTRSRTWLRLTAGARALVAACGPALRAAFPARRLAVHHVPDRRAGAGARTDRAVADISRRLRRHDFAGADDGRRHRRLRDRRSSASTAMPRSTSTGRGGWPCRARSCSRRLLRAFIGWLSAAHRGHLHDHDHAGDRRGVLLPGAAELQRVQRLPGPAARSIRRWSLGVELARSAAVLSVGRWRGRVGGLSWQSSTWCARRSASRCRAFATTRAAWSRSDSMSWRTASPPTRWPALLAAVGGVLFVWYNGLITPGIGRHLLADQHPDHRGARRHAASDRTPFSARWCSCCCRPSRST